MPNLTAEPCQIPGIEVIGPGAPEFEALAALPVEVLGPAVVLRNGGSRVIVWHSIRFDHVNAEGQPIYASISLDMRGPGGGAIGPGALRLVTMQPDLSLAIARGLAATVQQQPGYPVWAAEVRELLKIEDIRASLDGVIFDDGEFAGPDRSGQFLRLQEKQAARLEFLTEFRSRSSAPPSELTNWLEGLASQPKPSLRSREPGDARTTELRELAMMANRHLRFQGLSGLEELLVNRASAPAIWKR